MLAEHLYEQGVTTPISLRMIIFLISLLMVAVTVSIHGFGSEIWTRIVLVKFFDPHRVWKPFHRASILILTTNFLLVLHLVEVMLWAMVFLWLPDVTEVQTFEEAFYFSLITFTTVGYGDITLGTNWRVLGGVEAINGVVLIGWTTAFLFGVVQRTWKEDNAGIHSKQSHKEMKEHH
ncbi:potassium channel family protein [Rubellicoccus peritrichatus]|uniref:Ion channel n=1 Tax=Rubellicoccus peritrichatus TaxID=3080537 RepID=A0AAQ3LEH7_9BACT|nr:ion channel [Puniceicoccus sp. CR14]WOO42445.1 ion channel [Puniceicoccus sp. CR14]